MKEIRFSKYQGTGNDFVVIDNREVNLNLSVNEIVEICNRRFGVGSDGIILIEKDAESDFYMNFYNPDGSQSFCGNGSRCAVKFASELLKLSGVISFRAIDGSHEAKISENQICVRMKDVDQVNLVKDGSYYIHTGSPHHIIYAHDVDSIAIVDEARKIRYSEHYAPAGVNVNYVEEMDGMLKVRTYERGVEDETYSCGTGVTAVGLSYGYLHPAIKSAVVQTKGGNLDIKFDNKGEGRFENIWLCGPAEFVFDGQIKI